MPTLIENKDKHNRILSEAAALLQHGLGTPEQKEQYRKLLADADMVAGDILALEKLERYTSAVSKPTPSPAAAGSTVRKLSHEERRAEVNACFRDYLQNGYNPHRKEQRDLLLDSDGAAIVPQEFAAAPFSEALKMYGPIASLVQRKDNTTGRPVRFVVTDDTQSTMSLLNESGDTAPLEEDPSVLSRVSATDTLVTLIKFSAEELADAFDLERFLEGIAGLRVSRAVEYALTVGRDNGTNTQLPNSPVGGLLGSVSQGATTASLSAGVPYAALAALASSVDHAYFASPSAGFMVSPSVHSLLISATNSTGSPMYSFGEDGLLLVAGKPVYVNAAMPSFGPSQPIALFGDYSRAYGYVNGGGVKIKVLKERFSDISLRGLLVYHRLGAARLVDGAVKALVTAAS